MKKWINIFLTSNEASYRLLRTIVQGVIGVLMSNIDVIIGTFSIDPALKSVIVALSMCILSPIMAELGKRNEANYGM